MAPDVNWEKIDVVATGESNENAMEEVADIFKDLNESSYKEDPEKLVVLFRSAKKILEYREKAVTNILQEQEEKLEEKDAEIDYLKKNLEDERKFGSGSIPHDAEFYRIENRKLTEENESYRQQTEDLRREIATAVEERSKFEAEADNGRKLIRGMKAENQELRMNLHDYQNIVDKQQQEKIAGGDQDARTKLNERNKQISDLLTQITHLEELNRRLDEDAKKLRQEMESGQEDMEKMAEEYEKMRKVIGASDHFTDDLHRQNAQMKMQISDLRQQLQAKNQEDDTIAQAVNEKVTEWTNKLRERDQENAEQARVIVALREKIATINLNQDRLNVERLTKKLKESEAEIKQLQTGLNQAVGDLEEQTAIVEDLRRSKGTNRETLAYKAQIRNLQAQVQKQETLVREAETQRAAAENDAQDNDLKLTEALKRISLLESGQYGLTEAVNEIKECKNTIRIRNQEIRDLTKATNQLEEKINDLIEENEEYRERLGIDPRNMDDIIELRKSRALRQQQFRAENQVLLKEIETLEEERITLKKQIRRQAQSQTQKAVTAGLDPEDLDLIDEFIDELVGLRKRGILDRRPTSQPSIKHHSSVSLESSTRTQARDFQMEDAEKLIEVEKSENLRLRRDREEMMAENSELKQAMKDILHELRMPHSPRSDRKEVIRIPSLERLVQAMEARQASSHSIGGGYLKSEIDQLTGRNEELRSELRNLRKEHTSASSDNKSLSKQVEELRAELALVTKVTEDGRRVAMTTVALPTDNEHSSDDIINALNEQLIQVLDNSNKHETNVTSAKEALENSRRQLQVLRHQTHLLYKEHHATSEKWGLDRKSWEDEKRRLQEKIGRDGVRLDEYERLLSTLQSDPDEMKRRLAETSRKVSLLRVNEKTLIRRHKTLEASEELLVNDNNRLKKEIGLMEKAVSERIGYLERFKAMAAFKLESMQKALEGSIPEVELSNVNRRFDELTAKYRDLLQKENHFVAKNVKLQTLQEELKISMERVEALKEELSIEKEKRHTLEEAMKRSNISPLASGGRSSITKEAESALKKVTVLEMKELNERQRADHATRMHKQLTASLEEVQNRNSELELKFTELTKLNLSAQQTERELRDELAEVVPKAVSDADRKKINNLQEQLAKAKVKISKLQDMADISFNQLQSVQSQQQGREREMKSLRQQLREFQVQTDEHALIGQLHHQILNLQANEADTKRRLDLTKKNVKKLEAHVLKLDKQIDEKEDSVYLVRTESNNKVRQLKKTIQSLRQQFSGALPLAQQEKFSQAMIRLQEDRTLTQDELRRVRMEREKLEDRLAEADIQKEGLEELRKAIEDQRGADKLTEWSHRMDKLRLQDMKLQRQVVRQTEQIKYMENLNSQHEKTISSLEEDIVQMLKAQEEHQVEWEVREMELERLLDQFQSQQREVTKRAKRLEDITQTLPDPSLPVEEQLTKALETIKEQIRVIKDSQGQLKALQYENERLKDVRHNLEGDVTTRDRVINELRRNMPTTTSVTTAATRMDTESKQQLRVAMDSIETLKKRLEAKEESLSRYMKLLDDSRKEQEVASSNHERELMMMQRRVHEKTDDAFNKFKKTATASIHPTKGGALTSSELAHLNELEEMVKEQDAAMSALMDRIRAANADITKQKRIIADTRRQAEMDKSKIVEDYDSAMNEIRLKLAKKYKKVEDLEKELSLLKEELARQKEANSRGPRATVKNLVARLKMQLEEKEKQQQKLSHALTELRADLVHQAQENVRVHAAEEEDAGNVKILVNKRTAHYKEEIEELKDQIAELQRGLKQAKKTEDILNENLKKVLEETEKKQMSIKKLKVDLRGKDSEISQLKEKIKRLVKSRGPDAGFKFVDEVPVKLKAESSSSEDNEKKQEVEEDVIVPVESTSEKALRPSSGPSRLPRVKASSLTDLDKINKLRTEITHIKAENENLKEKLKLKTEEPSKSAVELAKWEAKKQWQGKLDQVKSKLQEKDKQIQAQEKQVTHLRETVSRLERDKLRRAAAPIGPPIHAQGTAENSVPPQDHVIRQHMHEIEDLSRRLHKLGEENSELRRLNVLPRNELASQLEAKNQQLSDNLDALQKEILTSGMRHEKDETLAEQFKSRESQLQGRILKLSSDNTQLMFEVEQLKLDVPRLQERLEYQQRYIDLLQSEKKEVVTRLDRVKGQQPNKSQSVGSSGKSVKELEKTVGLMKKVVERVQRENDQLKKAPGVVSNQELERVKDENQLLKNRINEMTQQIGGQLSMRYESKTQSVDRLIKENDRLRKELDKQANAKEKLFSTKLSLQGEREKLRNEVEELKKRLSVAEGKAPKIAGSGSRGYNSAVTAKMLESRLKKAEEATNKVTSEANALKKVLKEKSALERDLKEDNEKLHEQIEILERFPAEAGGADPNTVRELQIIRLAVARLETEKAELSHEIDLLKMRHGDDKNVISSVKIDDPSAAAENLKISTQLQVLMEEKKQSDAEVRRLKEELSHFDESFFDEIEDLKYNYAESTRRNILYEEQLRSLSRQFGVAVDIPSNNEEI